MRAVSAHMQATAAAVGLSLLALASVSAPHPLLVWNASASAPRGLYMLRHNREVRRGDLVLAAPPPSVRAFAARRGYLAEGVPLIKRIAATAGDRICSDGAAIRINDAIVAKRLVMDAQHRLLPVWKGCRTLDSGHVFLLMRGVPDSFDGRYFGATPVANTKGKLVLLWTY